PSDRHGSLAGIGFFILAMVSFAIGGDNEPDGNDSTAKVVAYWLKHDDPSFVEALLLLFAGLFLIWFAASLRSSLERVDDSGGRLPSLSFAAAIISTVAIPLVSEIYL